MYKKLEAIAFVAMLFFSCSTNLFGQNLKINDQEYFETQGLNVLVFSNQYNGMFFDEKTAGIELIHHGVRTATGGAIRLQNTPEQWDLVPVLVNRTVDQEHGTIEVELRYEEFDFNSKIRVSAKDKGVEIDVYLDKPVPEQLEGAAGLNFEFLPASYFEKMYLVDGKPGIFPRYPAGQTKIEPKSEKIPQFVGHTTFDDRGRDEFIVPFPLASGKTVVLAPEDPANYVKIQSDTPISLFDGRNLAQNGWFIVRSLLPANKTGKVLSWYLEPNAIDGWVRKPVVEFSQVGYVPQQQKVAVIELDANDKPLPTASIYRVTGDGKYQKVLDGKVTLWGQYLRYNYAKFDFSEVKEPGIYCIQYGDQRTNTFPIDPGVFQDVWHPTLDVWFPVQMDHMQVNEAYRTWHGEPYKDDCLQAPVNHEHFDGYRQGPTTETKYKPLERIPGMAVGGWFDAGDFDIQTGSHNSVISNFVDLWEEFKVDRDETYIDQKTRYVDIHRPDGKPDILQQIEHGTLNLVAQCENIGHPVRGIIVPNLHQYHHLGDASTETDNLPYNPNLKPYETDGMSSGTLDDRWAFTNRSSFLDYQTAASLAAAARALKGYNDDLAARSLSSAVRLLEEADEAMKNAADSTDEPWRRMMARGADLNTVLQLYITTKETKYLDRFEAKIWDALEQPAGNRDFGQMFFAGRSLVPALKAIPYLGDAYKEKLKGYIVKYNESIVEMEKSNPYGLPISRSGWGGSGMIVNAAITSYYAHEAFPDIISKDEVFNGLNFIFGCHPYSNISFVNAVGTRSKKVAYGNNRADFTTIAGGIVPGLLLLKPDFLENKDDWPFLWGENEVTIGGSAEYIFLSNAVQHLVSE
ncbi:glycoside hydrolase family 9 protein [Mangrovibacterium marinum]|uniref:Cellulase-like Ig domain-containing protein n=1 Tax=Mangrovibacterium marinum TaxID=1639118 RepID=A0A2T5BR44_9BACT|nr:glycoside hydrolase family 9 protein [Mangrovibacterium marinum]PTN01716.1 cellulase-like Ig domain-containing protein [Mangrovibacterium marinum]